jgi:threonyl-tRNA synthetase
MQDKFGKDEYSNQEFTWTEERVKPGHERPVIIHRAILGSVERFIAILAEHLNGKWPLWLSPRQVIVCSLSEDYSHYASNVMKELRDKGFETDIDISNTSVNKKVRNATLEGYNYILVVGEKE